ncbi:CPCC family cysteine-rich protein [Streptomyces mirabilis]|uniref:CPCC family cysteine-rich protein n=1 Tax=Streptomyces mirabilis TaxID=68239 RepID=UPI0036F13526
MVVRGSAECGPYRCPCCGFITLAERGVFEICTVCRWEDDGQDEHDASEVHGHPNRGLSHPASASGQATNTACHPPARPDEWVSTLPPSPKGAAPQATATQPLTDHGPVMPAPFLNTLNSSAEPSGRRR